MRSLAQIEACLERGADDRPPTLRARELLTLGEDVLEHWVAAKNLVPTPDDVEGFRLLALHRQGAVGDPSFNACRETCRELAYHYNLLCLEPDHPDAAARLLQMRYVASHLYYFVSGKLQSAQLGEFCCSARDLRLQDAS